MKCAERPVVLDETIAIESSGTNFDSIHNDGKFDPDGPQFRVLQGISRPFEAARCIQIF
jgi:hypothetical protein